MRVFLGLIILLAMPTFCKSQITYNKREKIDFGTIQKFDVITKSQELAYVLTPQEKAALLDEIKNKLNNTILNITNDSTHLKEVYVSLWGEGFYAEYLREAEELYKNLEANKEVRDHRYLLSAYEILHMLNDSIKSTLKPIELMKDSFIIKLTEPEILKTFLVKEYNATAAGLPWTSLRSYIADWRQFESDAKKIYSSYDEIGKIPYDSLICINQKLEAARKLVAFLDSLRTTNNLKIINLLQHPFFKQWLWFTEGKIYINPLGATVKERIYPANEINPFKTANIQKSIDSLQTSGVLDNFQETILLKYYASLPQIKKDLKHKARPPKEVILDYNEKLRYSVSDEDVRFPTKKKIYLLANNIPNNVVLEYVVTDSNIVNLSAFDVNATKELNSLQSFVSLLNPVVGIFSSIFPAPQTTIPRPIIPIPLTDPTLIPFVVRSKISDSSKNWVGIEKTTLPNKVSYIKIGKKKINFLFDNKKDQQNLLDSLIAPLEIKSACAGCSKVFFNSAEFFVSKTCFTLNYFSLNELTKTVDTMLVAYRLFRNNIEEQQNLTICLKEYSFRYHLIDYITYRSFPPSKLEEKESTSPILRSQAQLIDISLDNTSGAKKISIAITVKKENAGETEKAKVLQKISFKSAKEKRVILSAGLGFTTSAYTVVSAKDNNLPETSQGERFKIVAGLHYYFWSGLNNLDNRFPGDPKERLSVFVGLGIPKPLNNYYAGLSYDIVPGLKLITGYHLYKQTKFTILNNQVLDNVSAPQGAGIFISVNASVGILTSAINIFKK